jgi:hypothetical protein
LKKLLRVPVVALDLAVLRTGLFCAIDRNLPAGFIDIVVWLRRANSRIHPCAYLSRRGAVGEWISALRPPPGDNSVAKPGGVAL